MAPKLVVEFIGTFFLVLVAGLSGNGLAIGAVLGAMVYLGGHISGGNYNPAVSLGLWLRKAQSGKQTGYYMLVQLLAGVLAAGAVYVTKGQNMVVAPGDGVAFGSAFLIEVLFTFALVSVVLHVAATKATSGNQYFGLAIGLVLIAAAYAGGPISGGAFNPAVGLGPLLFNVATISSHGMELLLYSVGPLLGGALAAVVHRYVVTGK